MNPIKIDAIDPLGGILHPKWEERKKAEDAEAQRFIGARIARRTVKEVVAWFKADEPNLTTGDTMLIVDRAEEEDPPALTPQQEADITATVAVFDQVELNVTDFYEGILYPPRSPDEK